MTDKEIIKALECCIADNVSCDGCPVIGVCQHDPDCPKSIALDLINRQKAEIKNMFSARTYKALYETAKTEINKLQWQVNHLKKYDEERDIRLHARLTEKARAEAIKEFAERLKEKGNCSFGECFVVDWIDSLVKEMVGEE